MKSLTATLVLSLLVFPAFAGDLTVTPPAEVKWTDVPSLPKGVQGCLQHGDPKTGPTISLVKIPAGTVIPPHTHPGDECVTIVSGKGWIGQGETVDEATGKAVEAGAYFTIPSGTPHWFKAETEVVMVRYTTGAAEITYCNPAEDPRGQK